MINRYLIISEIRIFLYRNSAYIRCGTIVILAPEGGQEIFKEKITEIVAESKIEQMKKDKKRVITKIKKEERLSSDEFWNVYNLIHKDGPTVKYTAPNNWNRYIE